MDYSDFIKDKISFQHQTGFDISLDEINPMLKPHQKDSVQWGIKGGCRAWFEAFGLGKSFIQLEAMRLIGKHKGGRQLIIAPLGVRQEFKTDAQKLGIEITFLRRSEEIAGDGIYITNYESVRDGRLDPNLFIAATLDEAAVLRSYGSKTYQTFLGLFESVRYRFVATATPSPNRYKELIHYGGFLGIMDTGQALAQPLYSKVLTPSGWSTMGDIHPGSTVISVSGKPTNVTSIHPQGVKDIYEIDFSDGTKTECTGDHLWETQTQYERNAYKKYADRNGKLGKRWKQYFTVKNTLEIKDSLICESTGSKNHSIPMVNTVEFNDRDILEDPYIIGCLLGDGCIRKTSISLTTADEWIVDEFSRIINPAGLITRKSPHIRKYGQPNYNYLISTNGKKGGSGGGANRVLTACQKYKLCGKRAWEKHIPEDFIYNNVDVRLAVLQGLMDTDGTISTDIKNRTLKYLTTSIQLAKDVTSIVQSLGGVAITYERQGIKPDGNNGRLQYYVSISLPNGINPFRMPRKADLVKNKTKYMPIRYITNVSYIGKTECQCIYVEDDRHLYLTDNFIVTHNTRFFKRDSTQANNLQIHPHKEKEFWLWVNSWSLFLQRPSDLGYSDDGYDLPPLKVHYHKVISDSSVKYDRDGQAIMFNDSAMSLQAAAKEKRESIDVRVEKMLEIVNDDPDNHYIIWHDQEAERHAVKKALPKVVEVFGSQDLDLREDRIIGFSNGEFQYLATKPVLSGSGCNFQRHCHKAIFLGIGFKFQDFIQACHRIYRFLQEHQCEIHIIYAESESSVLEVLKKKWIQHEKMVGKMTTIIKKYGLSNTKMENALNRTGDVARIEKTGENWIAANNDCVDETRLMDSNSVDLIHTSIPFSNHYEYTPSLLDFGHTDNNNHFWAQMDYLTPELHRVLKPGRIYACHVKDRILFGNVTGKGVPTVSPFHMETTFHSMKHGFDYLGMITIVTDVVRENNQTYRLGWTEQCKDATKMGVGSPEYVLLFRKPQTDRTRAYADEPVSKTKDDYTRAQWQIDAHSFWRSSGDRLLAPDEMALLPADTRFQLFREHSRTNVYDYDEHVKFGSALDSRNSLPSTFMSIAPESLADDVWTDVNRMLTLNGSQARRGLNMHICPLQIDIVDRIINRFSNPGDLVYDPFGGLMTVPIRAIKTGRRGRGVELNPGYFQDGIRYLESMERELNVPTMFAAFDEHQKELEKAS